MEPEYFKDNELWKISLASRSWDPEDPNSNIRVFIRREFDQGRITPEQHLMLSLKYSR